MSSLDQSCFSHDGINLGEYGSPLTHYDPAILDDLTLQWESDSFSFCQDASLFPVGQSQEVSSSLSCQDIDPLLLHQDVNTPFFQEHVNTPFVQEHVNTPFVQEHVNTPSFWDEFNPLASCQDINSLPGSQDVDSSSISRDANLALFNQYAPASVQRYQQSPLALELVPHCLEDGTEHSGLQVQTEWEDWGQEPWQQDGTLNIAEGLRGQDGRLRELEDAVQQLKQAEPQLPQESVASRRSREEKRRS
jgi:hypothetical protein